MKDRDNRQGIQSFFEKYQSNFGVKFLTFYFLTKKKG